MEPKEQTRVQMISGINVSGEPVEADYAANLMNVVTFFEPVSRSSLDTLKIVRHLSKKYTDLSVGFWYVMEPRLSCLYRAKESQLTLERLGLPSSTIFDANNMIVLQFGITELPAVLVIDSNSFIKSRYEAEISPRSLERTIQARLAVSGYRDELPDMDEAGLQFVHTKGSSVLRQLGYVTGDYVFTSLVVPEINQEFSLPDFCLLNTIYPHGSWYVGRDFIEGSTGSTVYVSCAKDETVFAFAGSCEGATVRMHTSIGLPGNLNIGGDVRKEGNTLEVNVCDCRPYELLTSSGDADILISLQVQSGSIRLYSVEFCELAALVRQPDTNWSRFFL